MVGDHEIEIQGPNHFEEAHLPSGPLIFKQILESCSGILTLLLGLACRKSAQAPTRASSWSLFKKALLIHLLQFLILVLSFITI